MFGWATAGAAFLMAIAPATVAAQTPTLAQLPGPAGCIAKDAGMGCAPMTRTSFGGAMTPSPDGRHLYVTGQGTIDYTLSTLRRDPVTGALTEAGCRSRGVVPGCVETPALLGLRASAISPDGRNIYTVVDGLAAQSHGAVITFVRDAGSGDLAQVGCTGAISAACQTRDLAVAGANAVAVAPDGAHVYVVAQSRVLTFARSGDGSLTRVDCVGADRECQAERPADECQRLPPGHCYVDPGAWQSRLAFSADGRRLYLAGDRAVPQVFARDPASGRLTGLALPPCTQLGPPICGPVAATEGLAVPRDGRHVYSVLNAMLNPARPGVASLIGSVQAANRGVLIPSWCLGGDVLPSCAPTAMIGMPAELAMAPGDGAVYAVFGGTWPNGPPPAVSPRPSSGVAVLARDRSTGALGEASCVTGDGTGGRCVQGSGLGGASRIAVSPDGRNVYVGGTRQIAVLGPAVALTAPSVRFDSRGRSRVTLSCPRVARQRCRGRMALAARSRTVATRRFSIAAGRRARLRVRLTRGGSRALRRGRRVRGRVTLRAGGRVSGRSVRAVTLRRARR